MEREGDFHSSFPFPSIHTTFSNSTFHIDTHKAGCEAGVCYLGWLKAFLCELADLLFNFGSSALKPRRRRAFVRDAPLGDPLSGAVHATHGDSVGGGRGLR